MRLNEQHLARFAADLDALVAPGALLGVAVSGGPDSLALLLLAAAARPGRVRAATVDHALREGSRAEAEAVAGICAALGVPHDLLTIDWKTPPTSAFQEQARHARYAKLGEWASEHGILAVATGHHADDQAETLLMRLNRGSGVRGLAAMRPAAPLPGNDFITLVRPFLHWRRAILADLVIAAGFSANDDPSNHDDHHERVRIRRFIAQNDWLDPAAIAASATHLAAADEAIDYAVTLEWRQVESDGETLRYDPRDTPPELRRRLAARMIATLASEGDGTLLRGRELDRLLGEIEAGSTATLRGVLCSGGPVWHFRRAPKRQ